MTIPYVRATGTPYERGRRHGQARAAALRAFLDDGLARLDRILPQPVPRDTLGARLDGYDRAIAAATPQLSQELDGLADGAGLTRAEAVLLQVRRELLGYTRIPATGDCTAYARAVPLPAPGPPDGAENPGPCGATPLPAPGPPDGAENPGPCGATPVLAQTVDLNGDLDDQIAVLNTGRALVLSFGGLLGYLGLNDSGLAVGLNLVLGGRWRPGLPPYLAIRHLLDVADSVAGAVKTLRDLPLASSRSIMLCDRERAGFAEILGDEVRFHEAAEPVHTNHFLDPGFAAQDELNVFARNSSLRRLQACRAGLAELAAGAGAERHFELLSRPPITVGDSGDVRRERTVAAIVAFPGRGELHVRPGDPSQSDTEVFRLR